MSRPGLEELYRKTLINVHPPDYDAFGMCCIEAAAFGAPTLFNVGADVGSKAVLGLEGDDAWLEEKLDDTHAGWTPPEDRPTTADFDRMDEFDRRRWIQKNEDGITEVLRLVRDEKLLRETAVKAKKRAVVWTEASHGKRLLDLLVPVLSEAKEAKRQIQVREERLYPKDGHVRLANFGAKRDADDDSQTKSMMSSSVETL